MTRNPTRKPETEPVRNERVPQTKFPPADFRSMLEQAVRKSERTARRAREIQAEILAAMRPEERVLRNLSSRWVGNA